MHTRLLMLGSLLAGGLYRDGAAAQTVRVVNMIPPTLSGETYQNSEPDITVNPNDPHQIVASAFTPNPSGSTSTAPIFCSANGGTNWVLANIVPSANGNTGDITVAISRSNLLYAGILRGGAGVSMRILRSPTCFGAGAMSELLVRPDGDQPYTRVYMPIYGAQTNRDHMYVGYNDQANFPQSASLEQSLDAATLPPPAGLAVQRLERRVPAGNRDGAVRVAIHPAGTVYAVYLQWTYSDVSPLKWANVVVVRDDDWGEGAVTYADLVDGGVAGRIVASQVRFIHSSNGSSFGQERLVNRATIAVDPTDDRVVYVGWVDRRGTSGITAAVHLRRSGDGGDSWSGDLLTIAGAINPQLAVNVRGTVGVLYQQLTGFGTAQRWVTHFRQSADGGATWSDITLATVPAAVPAATFLPYLGDYAGLTAVGQDFYGVFSANNTPDLANFPSGVTFQRSADFTTHQLTNGGATVAVSIDPFFFHIGNRPDPDDFFVRDWTHAPVVHDRGLEPSTEPVFYVTSDVWNRRTNAPGTFTANNLPVSENPQVAALGSNFAFARVHRKAGGPPQAVTLRFLKAEFGTGSNYTNAAAAADPVLSFGFMQQAQTLATGYPWVPAATSSVHLCLAVEIATAADPTTQPSLLGRAPGWPDADLAVIYDNNRAQRNLQVYTGPDVHTGGDDPHQEITYWAVVHNAATRRRDLVLQVQADSLFTRLAGAPQIEVAGRDRFRSAEGGLVLLDMKPGENRWVGLRVRPLAGQREGERAMVVFSEMRGALPVNGFAIAVQRAPLRRAGVEGLTLLASNLHRLGTILQAPGAADLARELRGRIPAEEIEPARYAELVRRYGSYRAWVEGALRLVGDDLFAVRPAMDSLEAALEQGDPGRIYPHQSNLDHGVDALLTLVNKQRGDEADVAQNVRWQADLIESVPGVRRVEGAEELAELSRRFDLDFAAGQVSARDYSRFVERTLPVLHRLDARLRLGQSDTLRRLHASLGDGQMVQKAHRDFLLRLEELRQRPEPSEGS